MDRRKIILVVALVVAVLGTGLVFLYVSTAEARSNQRFAAVDVLVAKEPIIAGETLASVQAAGKLELRAVSAGSVVPGALTTLDGMAEESVAVADLTPGEQILESKFGTSASGATLTVDEGDVAISVQLTDTSRVAGFVQPGDDVVVFATSTGGAEGDAGFTRILLREAKVVAVGNSTVVSRTVTAQDGAQTVEEVPKTLLTLSLDDQEAQRVVFGASKFELSFALRNDESKVGDLKPTEVDNVFQN